MKMPHRARSFLLTLALLLSLSPQARAQFTFASDQGSNYGSGWGTGTNQGTGFGAWTISTAGGGSKGSFIGDPSAAGIGPMSAQSFGLFANSASDARVFADRSLASAMQVGDTFSFQWGINWDGDGVGRDKGFRLYTGGAPGVGTQVIDVLNGGSSDIFFNGNNVGFGFGTNVMTWTFNYANATTLTVSANDRDGSGTFTTNITVSGGLSAFRLFATNLASGAQREPYYNLFQNTNSGLYNVATTQTESRYLGGSGNLAKTGAGTLIISGATNNFTGSVGVTNGALRVTANNALGNASGVTVESGAALELAGAVTNTNSITINGSGVGDGGAIRSFGNGESTLTGPITLAGNARIQVAQTAPTTLAVLGTNDFGIVPEFGNIGPTDYSQTATNWTMNYTVAFGGNNIASGTLGGMAGLDLSGFSNLGILMSRTSTNNLPFSLEFFDSDSNLANTYAGSIAGLGSSLVVNPLTLDTPGTGNMNGVIGMTFTWNGAGAVNTTLASIVGLSTSGLTISGNIAGGANVLTLGAAGATTESLGGNMLISGSISGAGGSYGGTTTSLVKDGAGTVTLTGSNNFTGDIRVESGALAAGATNSLGFGADVILSAGSALRVNASVAVGSVQGTSSSSGGVVVMTNNALLNVSGAALGDVYQPGAISGQGQLTLSGSNTTLHLSGNNTFTGATRVEAGTLVVEATGGNQALRDTASVTVLSGAKLLVNTSDQVRDSAAVTLSGGTIQRGSGVSEVFGDLNLTSASFIDFGTGGAGTLAFGTYTPTSLLTVQNFNGGNILIFKSNLSGSITNSSFFSFAGGGIASYAWDGGSSTFTITAIPEPSAVLAALGLLGLMLWSQRSALTAKR